MLEVTNISVFYGKIRALNSLSVTVNAGEVFSLIGANGAGKTTLLRTIMGLIPYVGGSIRFQGQELTTYPPYIRARMGISIAPEGRGLFPKFTAEENLMAGAFPRSNTSQVKADLAKVYEIFPRLAERRRQLASSLSGGEGQMLALGRALMNRPKLLLMDEPSMGLMPILVTEIFSTITRLKGEDIAILLVEQNAKKALAVASRAAVLQLGEITVEGRPQEVSDNDQVKKAYLGG